MFNLDSFIRTFTYLGVFSIIYAESGLLVGLIFPGDSLLFLAGGLAAQHIMNFAGLVAVLLAAAILGNITGYWIGHKFGPQLFSRSRILSPDQLRRAERFFAKHGGKAVIIGRFVPVVRTLVPLLAGIGKMPQARFNLYTVIGAVAWIGTVTSVGYYAGTKIPNIDHYVLPVVLVVILATALPWVWHLWQNRRSRA